MVTVSGFKQSESKDGHKFFSLILQGGLEMVRSKAGSFYATAKQTTISSTFDEQTCQRMVGSKLPGKICKINCDPYEYTVRETGELITLTHRWVYDPNEAGSFEEVVFNKELTPEGISF